jgi:hypothetical protein
MVGSTGRAFRSLRNHDPDFAAKAEAAGEQGPTELADSIRAEMFRIGLGHLYEGANGEMPEAHAKQFEALLRLAETYLPEMEHKRRRHVTHDGEIQHRLIPEWIDQEKLDALPAEERAQLIELSRKIAADRPPRGALNA